MTLAAQSLEEAIFAHLEADPDLAAVLGGDRFFRYVPRESPLPYLTMSTSFSRDWSTGTEQGDEHRVLIHVWAGATEQTSLQTVMARLRVLLQEPDLTLSGHHLVNLRIERTGIRRDVKRRLLQAILQLRAVTEEQPA